MYCVSDSTQILVNSTPAFTQFNDTACGMGIGNGFTLFDLESMVTNPQTGDLCQDWCLETSCDSFTVIDNYNGSPGCYFSMFDSGTYSLDPVTGTDSHSIKLGNFFWKNERFFVNLCNKVGIAL